MTGNSLWFFWGQPHMTYLRWLTLYSAKRIHQDVRLVVRANAVAPKVDWVEKQDFQFEKPVADWMPYVAELGVQIIDIQEVAPNIAAMHAPDIQTADLLRLYLISEFGGTTADMDIVFFRPLPDINQDVQLVKFTGHPKPNYVPIGFMQGRPCQWWRDIYFRAMQRYDPCVYQSCGDGNFPTDVVPALSEHVIFPWAGHLYPWSKWRDWTFKAKTWPIIPDDCVGLHWCASHAQEFNQKIGSKRDIRVGAIKCAADQVLPRT